MMRAVNEHASSTSLVERHFDFTTATQLPTQPLFKFETLPLPGMGLTFLPRPPPRPRKRSRAAADIDGEHSCMQKKKRRLRLFLITSRLSPQFSHPATNIVDRGSSKIAVWAKQKSLGRNLLRKAAILNRIRRRAVSAKEAKEGHGHVLVEQEREQEELALAKLEFDHGSVDTYTRPVTLQSPSVPPAAAIRTGGRFVVSGSPTVSPTGSPTSSRSPSPTPPAAPLDGENVSTLDYCSPNDAYAYTPPRAQIPRRDYLPLPPSPLGLSNYDAFDIDEDMPDPYSYLDDEDDEPSTHLFDDDDDEEVDSVPFSPSAFTCTSSSTRHTSASQVLKTPKPTPYSDFSILGHSEPVFGDYDGVDDGADAIWPSSYAKDPSAAIPASTSPDFHALFATSPPQKRTDSFATSPNFRPTVSASATPSTAHIAASPNFAPSGPASVAPTFAPSATSTVVSSNIVPASVSPNFAAIDAPAGHLRPFSQRRMSVPTQQRPDDRTRRHSDIEQERRRQRDIMFTRFGS